MWSWCHCVLFVFTLVSAHGCCGPLSSITADLWDKVCSLIWFVRRVMFYKKNMWGRIELTKWCEHVMMMVMMMGTHPNWPLPCVCVCVCVVISGMRQQRSVFVPQAVLLTRNVYLSPSLKHCHPVVVHHKRPNVSVALRCYITLPLTSLTFFGFFANLTF